MSLVLYQMKASPPCRAVIIVAKLTGLVLELKVVNVLTKDQMEPEFLKVSPFVDDPPKMSELYFFLRYCGFMKSIVLGQTNFLLFKQSGRTITCQMNEV